MFQVELVNLDSIVNIWQVVMQGMVFVEVL